MKKTFCETFGQILRAGRGMGDEWWTGGSLGAWGVPCIPASTLRGVEGGVPLGALAGSGSRGGLPRGGRRVVRLLHAAATARAWQVAIFHPWQGLLRTNHSLTSLGPVCNFSPGPVPNGDSQPSNHSFRATDSIHALKPIEPWAIGPDDSPHHTYASRQARHLDFLYSILPRYV